MLKSWLITGMGLVLVMSADPARAGSASEAEFKRALQLTKKGKYAAAIRVYEAMLKKKPRDKDALSRIGPLYFLTGRFASARLRYRKATRAQPSFAKGWYFYAYSLRRLGSCHAALAAYKSYRKLMPRDPHPYYGMARCHLSLKQYAQAKAAYDRFVALAARNRRLTAWVARARAERKALMRRLSISRAALAVKKVLTAARVAFKAGQMLKAEKILKSGHKKIPGSLLIVDALADLLIRQRRCGEAVTLLRKVLKPGKPFVGGRYKLALCLRLSKDYAGAEKSYRAVLKIKPRHPDAHYGLAETLRLQGKIAEALRFYRAYVVIEQRPLEQVYVTKARKQIAALSGQLVAVKARRVAPRPGPRPVARRVVITDPRIRAIMEARRRMEQRQRGEEVASPRPRARKREPLVRPRRSSYAQRRRQRIEAARRRKAERLRKRAEARRRRAEARRLKLEAYRAKKRLKKAKRLAKRVLRGRSDKLTPEVRKVLEERAEEAAGLGKHAKALKIWQRLHELVPGDQKILRSMAETATGAGEHRVAAGAYQKLLKLRPKDLKIYSKLRAAQRKAGLPLTPLPLRLVLTKDVLAARQALKLGRTSQAITWAKTALRKNPRDAYAYIVLADAHMNLGKRKQGLAYALKAARLNAKLAGPYRVIGSYHLRLRDRSKARTNFKAFMARVAGDPTEAHMRAYVKALLSRLPN